MEVQDCLVSHKVNSQGNILYFHLFVNLLLNYCPNTIIFVIFNNFVGLRKNEGVRSNRSSVRSGGKLNLAQIGRDGGKLDIL